jgi:hypothetical protein
MVVQKAVKTYPLLKWLLVLSAVVVVVGLFMSGIATDPDNADRNLFFIAIGIAVLLPFLALAMPRRRVVQMELPTDHLAGMSKTELEGVLAQLDAAKAKGEMDEGRYAKARERILAAMKAQKAGKAK